MEILIKNEQEKHDNDSEATASYEEFLYPPSYQFPPKHTPPQSNDLAPLFIELHLGCVMKPFMVENVQFKRRKIGNVIYKQFTNPSSKHFKISDPWLVTDGFFLFTLRRGT